MLELTKLPYFLNGQRCATTLVMKKIYSYIAHHDETTDQGVRGGKRSVVFLDEFDKTNQKVRDAVLLIMQSGPPAYSQWNSK
ncbi:hypothetical protein J4E91_002321 [Alternaria rosae]|nr:hypothetical protein J4E91_002321 [Alternaria rosae]